MSQKKQLTQAELEDLYRRFPQIDWANDDGLQGPDSLRHQTCDTRAYSQIPLDSSENGQNALPIPLRKRFKVISVDGDNKYDKQI